MIMRKGEFHGWWEDVFLCCFFSFHPEENKKENSRFRISVVCSHFKKITNIRKHMCAILPPTWRVAFRLRTLPTCVSSRVVNLEPSIISLVKQLLEKNGLKIVHTWFLAMHQYTPESLSFFPSDTERKKRSPPGKNIRRPSGCDPPLRSSLSLYHSMCGSGFPSALQFSVVGSFFLTRTSFGC